MRIGKESVIVLLILSILSTGFIQSQGPAIVTKDPQAACVIVWIDVSGNSFPLLPGGEGVVQVFLENVVIVETNSDNGNLNSSCQGVISFGEQVAAIDVVTGQPVVATPATRDEACEAVSEGAPDACRGNGAVIINTETTGGGLICNVNGIPTTDWIQVQNRSGRAVITCHVSQ